MKAEILKRKPFLHRYSQIDFGEQGKPGLYVKFTDETHKKWIARFAKAESKGLCQVIPGENGSQCLVIANGKGYLVDTEKKIVLTEFEDNNPIVSAVHTKKPDYFVAGTENSIFILNHEGMLKEIVPDFKVENFSLKKQNENSVSGWLESSINQFDNAISFKIDLSSFNLILNY
jgi:hypothetical protein